MERLNETLVVLAAALPVIREWISGRLPRMGARLARIPE